MRGPQVALAAGDQVIDVAKLSVDLAVEDLHGALRSAIADLKVR
jgi:hypothetical protein